MTVEVMKDLPTLPNPDETKVDSDPRPTHSPAIRKPPLERGVHHPKHTTRLWDNWYTVQQGRSTTHLAHLVQIERPILSAPAGYTQEICPPPPVSPSSSATTPGSGKRSGWGLFGSKKQRPDSPRFLKKKSRTLDAMHKSTPELNAHAHRCRPSPEGVPPVLISSPVIHEPRRPMAHETDPPSDSAIYIAVDPNWDPSQGDATLFFVSPPMDLGGLEDSECCLTPSFRDSAERNSSKTSVRRLASASAHQLFRPWREDVSPAHF